MAISSPLGLKLNYDGPATQNKRNQGFLLILRLSKMEEEGIVSQKQED